MFDLNIKKINYDKANNVIQKNLSLEENLDCFFIVSSTNKNFAELVSNNIVEYIIDRISVSNTYNDFSNALENINSFIKTWKTDTNKEVDLDVLIGVLHNNNLIFSHIGKASCYMLNRDSEFIEISDTDDTKTQFSFISNGELKNNELITISNTKILDYLSQSDILDGVTHGCDLKVFNENIKNILNSELLNCNISIATIKYNSHIEEKEENQHIVMIKEKFLDLADNKYSKKIMASCLVLKDKCQIESKHLKNAFFLTGILFCLFVLFSTLSAVINISTQNEGKEIARENIIEAKNYLGLAKSNLSNTDAFEINIKQAEDLLKNIESEQLFLNDVAQINNDINILKKEFNKIETFVASSDNSLYSGDMSNAIKVVKNNFKPYIINKKGVVGPILANTQPKTFLFTSLEDNEYFVDATAIGDNLYILTNTSKVVQFTKNGHFSFMDVSGQPTWQSSTEISSYAQNIYLLSAENSQINKHTLSGKSFSKASPYLQNDDLSQIGKIFSLAIDGGFYILKKDLSIVKFFSSPTYRLESIVLNKLPKNYQVEDQTNKIQLKARGDLNYVYMLLNNKIWIFQPNTTRYQDTKSLTYIGQIEGDTQKILDFHIDNDGIITLLNESGLYRLEFEISDNKLQMR